MGKSSDSGKGASSAASARPDPKKASLQKGEDVVAENVIGSMDWLQNRMNRLLDLLQKRAGLALITALLLTAAITAVVIVLNLESPEGQAAVLAQVRLADQRLEDALSETGAARDPRQRLDAYRARVTRVRELYREHQKGPEAEYLALHLARVVMAEDPPDDAAQAKADLREAIAALEKVEAGKQEILRRQAQAMRTVAKERLAWIETHGLPTWQKPPEGPTPVPVVDAGANPLVLITTERTGFVLELFADDAPNAVIWFQSRVQSGLLAQEGTVFDVARNVCVRFGVPFETGNFVDFTPSLAQKNDQSFVASDQWWQKRGDRAAPARQIAQDPGNTRVPDQPHLLIVKRAVLAQHGAEFAVTTIAPPPHPKTRSDELEHWRQGYEVFGRLIGPSNWPSEVSAGERIVACSILRWRRADDPLEPAVAETPLPVQLPVAVLKTTQGEIKVELFEDECPNTVANFVARALGEKKAQGAQRGDPLYKNLAFTRLGGQLELGADLATEPLVEFGSLAPDGSWEEPRWLPMEKSFRRHGTKGGRLAVRLFKQPGGTTDVPSATRVYITTPEGDLKEGDTPSFEDDDDKTIVFGRVTEGLEVLGKLQQSDRLIDISFVEGTLRPHEYTPKYLLEPKAP